MVQIPKRRVGGPAWRPGDPTLTVGQVAQKLMLITGGRRDPSVPAARPGDVEGAMALTEPSDTVAISGVVDTALVERIRHWTREQLLLPVSQIHAGTGRARLYSSDVVFDAALLHVLTSAGFTVSSMRYLVDALTAARLALPKWKKEGGPLYLVISRSADRTEVEVVRQEPVAATADLAVVVNLGRIFARVGGGNNGPSDK